MQTKPKSNSVITHEINGTRIMFKVLGAGDVTLDMARLNSAILERAALHGMIQRISDAAALGRDRETGLSATPLEKLNAMRELVDWYESGTADWKRVSEGGGGKSITLQAISELKGMTYDEAKASIDKYAETRFDGDTKKALAYLRKGEKVQAKIAEIRARGESEPVIDADEALNEIE